MLTELLVLSLFIFTNASPLWPGQNRSDFDSSIDEGEFGSYFEGDMLLTEEQREAISYAIEGRNGLRDDAKRWPNRTVVYHIVDDDFDEDQVKIIENGMADISNKSCLKFREREGDEHAVIIQLTGVLGSQMTHVIWPMPQKLGLLVKYRSQVFKLGSKNGCFSSVGLSSADEDGNVSQVLNLAKGCFKHGTVVHEMLHTLGFYHMQSTYDRDDFVEIIWENIISGHEHNFAKYNNDTVTDFGVPYDYSSVMHYPKKAFSKNGKSTIIPLKENATIGQRVDLSESDIIKLNRMYCEDIEIEDKQIVSL